MGLEAIAEQLLLDLNSLLDGQADAVVHCLLAVAHSNGSVLCDLAGQLQDILHQLSLRIHGVDQTDAVSVVSLDVQRRVDQLLCHAHADQTSQTLGAAEARGDAQTDFRLTEHSIIRADAEIAAHSQLVAAAQCKAVDGCDDGDGEMLDHQEHIIAQLGNDVFLMIEHFPIPVIAAVNGFALGGGNELAMSCDFRICSDNAVFGQPEVGLGITPGFGGTQRLARLVGMGMAKQLVYSALNIKADDAYRIGLVNAVYPQAELMENVLKLAGKIAKNAPIAVRNCKKAMNDGISLPIEKAVEVEEKLFGDCFETHDQQEGMACFLSREKPKPKAVFTNN